MKRSHTRQPLCRPDRPRVRSGLVGLHVLMLGTSLCTSCGDRHNVRPATTRLLNVNVVIGASAARGCDLVFEVDGEPNVSFGDTIRSRSFQRGNRLAVAFTARENAPLGSQPMRLTWPADAGVGRATAISWNCYDEFGHMVGDAKVSVSTAVSPASQTSRRSERGCQM
jgi:hypothetical protein